MSIKIYYDEIKFRLKEADNTKKFIEKVIRNERLVPGDLNFIFTTDKGIRKINQEFLSKDSDTDVIAFNYNICEEVIGEIYISIERVRENSHNYNVSLRSEVLRVMIHGVLHLCGYNDKKKEEIEIMRKLENKNLNEYFKKF